MLDETRGCALTIERLYYGYLVSILRDDEDSYELEEMAYESEEDALVAAARWLGFGDSVARVLEAVKER